MTLDEAIAHAREVAEEQRKACDLAWIWDNPDNIKKCAEEHDQLAEWLEELKELRKEKDKFDRNLKFFNEINSKCFNKGYSKAESDYHAQSEKDRQSSYDCGYDAGYNRAIDDFVNACKEDILCQSFGLHANGIERIAEQLKAGESE